MAIGGWLSARAEVHRWTLGFLFVLVAVLTAGLAGISGHLRTATVDAITATLAGGGPSASSIQVSTGLGPRPEVQNTAASTLFASALGAAVRIDRSSAAGPYPVSGGPARAAGSVGLRSYPDLLQHVAVTTGRWPDPGPATGPVPLAMLAPTASSLGLKVGDPFVLTADRGPTPARLAAILTPLVPGDPYFYEDHPGQIAITDRLSALASSVQVRWTIGADPARLADADIRVLAAAVADLRRAVNNDLAVNVGGVQQSGGLGATLTVLGLNLAASRAVAPIPALLLCALGLVLVLQVTQLIGSARRPEIRLLRSRGAGGGRLLAAAAAEALAVAAPATAVGLVLARAAVGRIPAGSVWWAVAVVLVVVAVTGLITVAQVARDGHQAGAGGHESGRARVVVTAGPAVLVVAAAIVCLWRFLKLGSAVTVDALGATVDPVAVLAAPLFLLAVAVLGAVLATVLVRITASMAGRSRGMSVMPLREISRRWPVFGAASLVVILAVSGTTVAAAFDRTWTDFRSVVARFGNAADVRVELPGIGDVAAGRADPLEPFAGLPAVSGATNALVTDLQVGDGVVSLTALPAADMRRMLPSVPGSAASGGFDAGAMGAALRVARDGVELPAGVRSISLRVTVTASSASAGGPIPAAENVGLGFVLWLAGENGGIDPVPLVEAGVPAAAGSPGPGATTPRRVRADLPAAVGTRWIVALDTMVASDSARRIAIGVDDIRVTSTSDPQVSTPVPIDGGPPWEIQPIAADGPLQAGAGPTRIGWSGSVPDTTGLLIRTMPAQRGAAQVPVAVDSGLADALGLAPGGVVDLQLAGTGRHLSGRVVSVSRVLPGASARPAVLADLGGVLELLLRSSAVIPASNQIWLSSSSPQLAADEARRVAGVGSKVVAVGAGAAEALVRPVDGVLWVAAGLSLLLAVLAVGALAATLAGQRGSEAMVLRAVGQPRRRQIRARELELVISGGLSLLLGLLGGAVVAAVTVGPLVRSAVDMSSQLTPTLGVARAGGWALLGSVLGAGLVVAGYGQVLRRGAIGPRRNPAGRTRPR